MKEIKRLKILPINIMYLEDTDYIKSEINRLTSNKFDCIYCYCDIDTILLNVYTSVSHIHSREEYDGNLVYIKNSEHDDINHYIFMNGKWFPAMLTDDEVLYAKITSELREHKINELID